MRILLLTAAALCLAQVTATARAEYATIEEAAVITDDNVFRLESDAIARAGRRLRFDVTVAWRDGFVRPEGSPPRKIIRYLTDCKTGELALASVAIYAASGQAGKTYGIAPGGWDFVKPAADSREAAWMKKVCDSMN